MNDYAAIWTRTGEVASEALLTATWRQWVALGSLASPVGVGREVSIIDPEALLLASFNLVPEERRLGERLRWWAEVGSRYTSLHRLRRLSSSFGVLHENEQARAFARWAMQAGDRRWKALADERPLKNPDRLRGSPELSLIEPATLLLRLRAGFGVGAKSDILAFLLGLRAQAASAPQIARGVGYTTTGVRAAVQEMAVGRVVREIKGHPSVYSVTPQPWLELLEIASGDSSRHEETPEWVFWADHFAILTKARELSHDMVSGALPASVAASRARDTLEEHEDALRVLGVPLPEARRYPGKRYAIAFAEVVDAIARFTAPD